MIGVKTGSIHEIPECFGIAHYLEHLLFRGTENYGSQKKIAERFTLAGEIVGITLDGHNIGVISNIILNFMRNSRENWSAGVSILNFEVVNMALNLNFIALPYIGIQRKF